MFFIIKKTLYIKYIGKKFTKVHLQPSTPHLHWGFAGEFFAGKIHRSSPKFTSWREAEHRKIKKRFPAQTTDKFIFAVCQKTPAKKKQDFLSAKNGKNRILIFPKSTGSALAKQKCKNPATLT